MESASFTASLERRMRENGKPAGIAALRGYIVYARLPAGMGFEEKKNDFAAGSKGLQKTLAVLRQTYKPYGVFMHC